MDLNSLNNRENKSLTEEYIARIQFKPLATNKDLAYDKIWNRIQSEKLVDFAFLRRFRLQGVQKPD